MSPHSLQQTTCACLLAAFDHVETLEWMLKASSVSDVVNHVDNSHSTPIMHALANASLRCVTLLLDMGAKTTVRCRNGLSLARFALGDGNHNVDTTGLRATGLHVAVQKRVDCMKVRAACVRACARALAHSTDAPRDSCCSRGTPSC